MEDAKISNTDAAMVSTLVENSEVKVEVKYSTNSDNQFQSNKPLKAEAIVTPVKSNDNDRVSKIMAYLRQARESKDASSALSADSQRRDEGSCMTNTIFDSVKAKILGQQMEIDEKTRTCCAMKKEILRLKQENDSQKKEHEKELASKIDIQRREYEAIISRHLALVDKMIAEKEELTKKCETYTENFKIMEKDYKQKFLQMAESHERDLKQKKETWEASERLRREKWIHDKTKTIKEQTVKSLEPEIQRMIAQHKVNVKRIEESLKDEWRMEKQQLQEHFQHELDAERRRTAEIEREFARQRYQKQLEKDEMEFQQMKRKLLHQFDEEKDKLMESAREERRSEEVVFQQQLNNLQLQLTEARHIKEVELSEIKRKHQLEMKKLQESLEIEREEWREKIVRQHEQDVQARIKNIKEELTKERDQEIELIIKKLESETSLNSTDLSRQHRAEVERLRRQFNDQMDELKEQNRISVEKIVQLQEHLELMTKNSGDRSKEILHLEHENLAKEKIIKQQRLELQRLNDDEELLKDSIRHEFKKQLEEHEKNISVLKGKLNAKEDELQCISAKWQQEIDNVTKEKDNQLQMVESCVKETLRIKDAKISELTNQLELVSIKYYQMESLLEKQRKELLE